jgi:hypothetical protein
VGPKTISRFWWSGYDSRTRCRRTCARQRYGTTKRQQGTTAYSDFVKLTCATMYLLSDQADALPRMGEGEFPGVHDIVETGVIVLLVGAHGLRLFKKFRILGTLEASAGARGVGKAATGVGQLGFPGVHEELGLVGPHLPLEAVLFKVVDAVSDAIVRFAKVEVAQQANRVLKVVDATGNSDGHEVLDNLEGDTTLVVEFRNVNTGLIAEDDLRDGELRGLHGKGAVVVLNTANIELVKIHLKDGFANTLTDAERSAGDGAPVALNGGTYV